MRSVVAYAVDQRARELGIRMALGAQPWNGALVILNSTVWTTVAGLLLRIGMSIGVSDAVFH